MCNSAELDLTPRFTVRQHVRETGPPTRATATPTSQENDQPLRATSWTGTSHHEDPWSESGPIEVSHWIDDLRSNKDREIAILRAELTKWKNGELIRSSVTGEALPTADFALRRIGDDRLRLVLLGRAAREGMW